MRKTILLTGCLLILSLTLSACGSYPKMTESQDKAISNYATSLLLKYDAENHSRLVDTSEFMDEYNAAWEAYNKSKEAYEAQKQLEEKKKIKEIEKENEASSENTTPVVDRTETYSSMPINTFLDIDYTVEFADYFFADRYPEKELSLFEPVSADEGMKLLVLRFNVTNNSSSGSQLDIMSKGVTFKVSVNDASYHSAYKTLLDDELSEYFGDFGGNETKQLVLIAEVEENCVVESINLRLSDTKGNQITKKLY